MQEKASRVNLKKIFMYVFYISITLAFLLALLIGNDIEAIFEQLKDAKPEFIVASFLCIIVYMALYPVSLCILTKARGCKISMRRTYSIAMIEHFFNGITPLATGGQPFQVYGFAKSKVKPSESTCLLLMNFMVFMLVTNGFAACALFYAKNFFFNNDPAIVRTMAITAVIGFAMNFVVLAVTFLVATIPGVATLFSKILGLFCRIKIVNRFLGPKKTELEAYFVSVQEAFAALIKKFWAFMLAFVAKALSMASYYLTTFFILKALGVDVGANDVFFVICGSSFAITMTVFLPTPGASGVELAFMNVFASLIMSTGFLESEVAPTATGVTLIWRLLTYYFVMIISLMFYIALEVRFAIDARIQRKNGLISSLALPQEPQDTISEDGDGETADSDVTEPDSLPSDGEAQS